MARLKLSSAAFLLVTTLVTVAATAPAASGQTTEATILVTRRQPQKGAEPREDYVGTHAALLRSPLLAPPHAVSVQGVAPEQRKQSALAADFTGKIVFVQTVRDAATLEQARIVHLADRPFLAGRVVRDEVVTQGQYAGTTSYVPVADIVRLIVCDNLEQLKSSAPR